MLNRIKQQRNVIEVIMLGLVVFVSILWFVSQLTTAEFRLFCIIFLAVWCANVLTVHWR